MPLIAAVNIFSREMKAILPVSNSFFIHNERTAAQSLRQQSADQVAWSL